MRLSSTIGRAVQYSPADPPSDMALLPAYLRQEFAKMKAAIDLLAEGFDTVVYAPPDKPRIGMRRYADGVQWNPGFGGGPYYFDGNTWRKMDMLAGFALRADGSIPADGAYMASGLKLI